MQREDKSGLYVDDPYDRRFIYELNSGSTNIWNTLCFSIIFQFIPIGIMSLIQYVSTYGFGLEDYIGNLLVFDIVTCGVNLSDLSQQGGFKGGKASTIIMLFLLITILCLTSILYCLLLLYDIIDFAIKKSELFYFSWGFTMIICVISIWRAGRKQAVRKRAAKKDK